MIVGWLAERRERMSCRAYLVFTLSLFRVVSLADVVELPFLQSMEWEDFRHFYVNNDQKGITEVGWMIIIHISHACISFCDGLQRMRLCYWTNSRGRCDHILGLPPAHWFMDRLQPVGTPSLQMAMTKTPQQPSHFNSGTFGNLL